MSTETQPRDRVGRWRARWRHNWVPLNWAAALLKAHHSRRGAERIMQGYRHPLHGAQDELPPAPERRFARLDRRIAARDRKRAAPVRQDVPRRPTSSGTEVAKGGGTAAASLRKLSDDELAARMADADDKTLSRLVRELDRRDRAEARRLAAKAKKEHREAERDRAYDEALDRGADPEQAFADIYGGNVAKLRRGRAIDAMKAHGYKGNSVRELAGAAFKEHAELSYLAAEDATRGHLLNAAGKKARVNPRSLFTGPEARARKYASEDLLRFWQQHHRLTADDFHSSAIGGRGRANATKDFY